MALPKKYSNQYISSEGVVMETEPNGEVVIKQIPQTPDELPTVSGTDNGKILKVVEGAWAAAAAPTSGTLVVTDDDGVLDTSWQGIFDAMVAGTITVIMTIEGETSVSMAPVVYAAYAQEAYGVQTAAGDLYISLTADGYPEEAGDGGNEGGGEGTPVA